MTGDVTRSPTRTTSPPLTAAPQSKSPPGRRSSAGSPGGATASWTTPSTWRPSLRSVAATARAVPTTTARSPRGAKGKTHKEAPRALKRRISDALFAAMVADAGADTDQGARRVAREGKGGTAL